MVDVGILRQQFGDRHPQGREDRMTSPAVAGIHDLHGPRQVLAGAGIHCDGSGEGAAAAGAGTTGADMGGTGMGEVGTGGGGACRVTCARVTVAIAPVAYAVGAAEPMADRAGAGPVRVSSR
ncbi:hypothetical protein GCM10027612_77560 [Microbispora bryophytorum subsp. camponoti]